MLPRGDPLPTRFSQQTFWRPYEARSNEDPDPESSVSLGLRRFQQRRRVNLITKWLTGKVSFEITDKLLAATAGGTFTGI